MADYTTSSFSPWTPNQVVALQALFAFLSVVGFQIAIAHFQINKEAKRRWQHVVTGHSFVLISYLLPLEWCVAALLTGALGIYYLILFHKALFIQAFGPLLREVEKDSLKLPGAFFFLLGTALTVWWFPLPTARYAVECLAIADPMASWVGSRIQSPKINASASMAGTLACFVTALCIGLVYLTKSGPAEMETTANGDTSSSSLSLVLWRISIGALACCIVEAVPYWDDNLVMPVVTAAAVHYMQ